MIDGIHQSTLNTAFRCGEQFRRRYIEGEIIPPSIAAGRGTAVHAANEVNLKQKVATAVDLPLSDLQDATRDAYVRAFRSGVYLARDQVAEKTKLLNQGLNESIVLTGLYHEEVAPEIVPLEVEREFEITVPGIIYPLKGRIDIERAAKVDDLKTASKSWPENRIHQEIQPLFYSFVNEFETGIRPEFIYHIMIPLKAGPKRQIQKKIPTERDYAGLIAKLKAFTAMLQAGVFPPANPTSWWCSERW